MAERQDLEIELGYSRSRRYYLCREAEVRLKAGLRAVDMIRQGNPNGARLLSQLCRSLAYEGEVLCVPVDQLLVLDAEQRTIVAQLDELEAAEEKEAKL